MFMMRTDCGNVFLFVMITYICLGHIICTLEESTKIKFAFVKSLKLLNKIVFFKIKQLSEYLLTPFNNSHIPN
jgi:hypothetical protein